MAQPSVASYFNTRKRNAIEDLKLGRAKKVLNLAENDSISAKLSLIEPAGKLSYVPKEDFNGKVVVVKPTNDGKAGKINSTQKKVVRATKTRKIKELQPSQDLQKLIENMTQEKKIVSEPEKQTKLTNIENTAENNAAVDLTELHRTPPSTPTKINALDKIKMTGNEMSMKEIRQKLSRSNKLAELKASLLRFKENDAKLKKLEASKPKVPDSPSLKVFKSLELEVHLSPQKSVSPQKAYLSPKKDSTARRNLLNQLTPTKNAVSVPQSPSKLISTANHGLSLPFKYRTLAEIFRSIDTVCQIMFNRKETITFKKLKPAVEEMNKRNLTEKHLAQIKHLYGDAFTFRQEKLRSFGIKQESWELVIEPNCKEESMNPEFLLARRRKFYKQLIDVVQVYHREFLLSLDPPMDIKPANITRWHAAFDLEKVPDIQQAPIPQAPIEEKFSTGKEVLNKAKSMFACNTRMEQALERLKAATEDKAASKDNSTVNSNDSKPELPNSVLKGIPKALLERVRQKQAAKALESMTRSDEKEKELQVYSQLPEIARLTRNLFVAEKKSVLPLDTVLDKLANSMKSFMTRTELEGRLKLLEEEINGWLVFHKIRQQDFVKISKNADLSLVLQRLDELIKLKSV